MMTVDPEVSVKQVGRVYSSATHRLLRFQAVICFTKRHVDLFEARDVETGITYRRGHR